MAQVNSLLSDCRLFYMCSLHDAPWASSLFEAAVQEKPWAPGTRDFSLAPLFIYLFLSRTSKAVSRNLHRTEECAPRPDISLGAQALVKASVML